MLPSAAMGRADLILLGDVFTVDAARRWAKAVAIKGDRIVAVGTESEVRDHTGPGADVISGALITPGFQDSHIHAAFGGRNMLNVDLLDLHDRDAYLERTRTFADAHPDLPWIVGGGWWAAVFAATEGPRKELLDAVVPDRPVFLMDTDVHGAWVNSEALEIAGVSASTPDPWDGYYVRDPDGAPTGTLQEGAAYHFLRGVIPQPDVAEWQACLRAALAHCHALGITGWQDAWVEEPLLRGYRALDDAGELSARVVASLWWDRHAGMEQLDSLIERRAWASGGNLDAGTVKLMLDGCLDDCASSMLRPFEGRFGERHGDGIRFLSTERIHEAVPALDAVGFQIHMHALGDRAVRDALDAVEVTRARAPANDLRHHIAHLHLLDDADVGRLRPLGVVANIQPLWAQAGPTIDELTAPRIGADRVARQYRFADLRASGAVMAFGSDWPVSSANPWEEMEVAVTRRAPGVPDGPRLDASQRLDLATAIAAFTRGSAYVNHDDDAGSIEVGKRADLAVHDANPFAEPEHRIHATRVTHTVAAGRVVHGA